MLYPKNILTYSAYVKNMESMVKNTLGLKKDLKLHKVRYNRESNKDKKKNLKRSETISASSKLFTPANNTTKKMDSTNEINEENHPTLKRRYARLFITVPKKSGYGYKLKYKNTERPKDADSKLGYAHLFHAHSDFTGSYANPSPYQNTRPTSHREDKPTIDSVKPEPFRSMSQQKRRDDEWL